jgi:hypothetical protein
MSVATLPRTPAWTHKTAATFPVTHVHVYLIALCPRARWQHLHPAPCDQDHLSSPHAGYQSSLAPYCRQLQSPCCLPAAAAAAPQRQTCHSHLQQQGMVAPALLSQVDPPASPPQAAATAAQHTAPHQLLLQRYPQHHCQWWQQLYGCLPQCHCQTRPALIAADPPEADREQQPARVVHPAAGTR